MGTAPNRGLRIDDDIYRRLRIRAAETGEPMRAIAERALRRELGMVERYGEIDAARYVVIADEQVVYPVRRADLGPNDTAEALAEMNEDEYQAWCDRVPADTTRGEVGTAEMTAFCDWLRAHGAERWEISPSGEYPGGRTG